MLAAAWRQEEVALARSLREQQDREYEEACLQDSLRQIQAMEVLPNGVSLFGHAFVRGWAAVDTPAANPLQRRGV